MKVESIDQIVSTIRKLMALGGSPNENEAASAVSKAQELLKQHDLSMEDISENMNSKVSFVSSRSDIGVVRFGKPEQWKEELFESVYYTSECRVMWSNERKVEIEFDKTEEHDWSRYVKGTRHKTRAFKSGDKWYYYEKGRFARTIGRTSDLELAHYSFDFLVQELLRLALAYGQERWEEIWTLGRELGVSKHDAESIYVARNGTHPLKAKISWLKGAVQSVCQKLHSDKYARDRSDTQSTALMVNKSAAIEDFLGVEQHGSWDAYMDSKRRWAETIAEWRREVVENACTEPTKAETEVQKAKREAREKKDRERWQRRYDREQEDRAKSIDAKAYNRGVKDGESIGVKPGIKEAKRDREIA